MGESKLKQVKGEETLMSCAGVQTVAGRAHIRWENKSAATPMGQLAYFIEFLTLTGLWSRRRESCPLTYSSPNAPGKADVLGTWMLSVLAGHKRYSHVTAIRCDGVNPGLMGMNKVISEDAMRGALKRIPEAEGTAWLDRHLSDSVAPLLDAPWIMDTDTTAKPLYGKHNQRLGACFIAPSRMASSSIRKVRWSPTTRRNRDARHTRITPTSWRACAKCWAWKYTPATNMRPGTPSRGC